ncbi:hypothetical protein V6N11_013122 [Hibiscus sabdariffa]|uniref:Uncharacterized protein n=2 Tax=Hibiscus sabdariffa TaxID=183260 RepID=A0ABR2B5U0_9ROSI
MPLRRATYGPVDVAPLRAIPISDAPSSLIVVTPLSANANASVADLVENAEDVKVHGAAAVGDHDLSDVFNVDDAGCVHVFENVLFGDENDVFATRISHVVAAPVKTAPSFDAIKEWLTKNEDSDVSMHEEQPIKVPAKRSSDGLDPSKVKRARSISSTSTLKDARATKAGISS